MLTKHPALASRFKVSATPTFLFVDDGKPILALATSGAQRDVAAWVAHVVDGKSAANNT